MEQLRLLSRRTRRLEDSRAKVAMPTAVHEDRKSAEALELVVQAVGYLTAAVSFGRFLDVSRYCFEAEGESWPDFVESCGIGIPQAIRAINLAELLEEGLELRRGHAAVPPTLPVEGGEASRPAEPVRNQEDEDTARLARLFLDCLEDAIDALEGGAAGLERLRPAMQFITEWLDSIDWKSERSIPWPRIGAIA